MMTRQSGGSEGSALKLDVQIVQLNEAVACLSVVLRDAGDKGSRSLTAAIERVARAAGQARQSGGRAESPELEKAYCRALLLLRGAARKGHGDAADALKAIGEPRE